MDVEHMAWTSARADNVLKAIAAAVKDGYGMETRGRNLMVQVQLLFIARLPSGQPQGLRCARLKLGREGSK